MDERAKGAVNLKRERTLKNMRLENLRIKGVTVSGEIFDDLHERCPECGKQGLKNGTDTELASNQEWNLDQYLDAELYDFNVVMICPNCGWEGSKGIKRATVHKKV